MDSSSIIIGLILLVLFVLPFILLQIGSYRKRKLFEQVCKNNAFIISEREDLRLCTMAMDKSQKSFLFYNQQKEKPYAEVVRIEEITDCSVIGSDPKETNEEPIGIQIKFKGTPQTAHQFLLAEKNDGIVIQEEAFRMAKRWQNKINRQLN